MCLLLNHTGQFLFLFLRANWYLKTILLLPVSCVITVCRSDILIPNKYLTKVLLDAYKAEIKLPGKGIWQESLWFLTSLLMHLHTAASQPHQKQTPEAWEMIVCTSMCQIPSRIAPHTHHIRVLCPCLEGITSLKCLRFKVKDEFTPVALSWPSFFAGASIL